MKISKNRLENTRFFDDVDITPQDTNIPGRRDMRVTVKEGRTGTFTFGAGYSSLERATVFAQIQQTNFDLFNRRSLFQGDGEKFSIKVSIGELSNEAVISFEEPYLFEKQLALGFSIFREQSDYVSTYYQELQEGGNVDLRKHLFGLFNGTLTYQYETINIYNLNPSASQVISQLGGPPRRLAAVSSRSSATPATSWSAPPRATASTSSRPSPAARSAARTASTASNSRDPRTSRSSTPRSRCSSSSAYAGVRDNYNGFAALPYYDAFYLGGPNDLRGFQYHEVSPRDQFGEPIGGKTYGMFTAEYSVEIVDPIRFAFFYDVGFVNAARLRLQPGELQRRLRHRPAARWWRAPRSAWTTESPSRETITTGRAASSIFRLAPASKSDLIVLLHPSIYNP